MLGEFVDLGAIGFGSATVALSLPEDFLQRLRNRLVLFDKLIQAFAVVADFAVGLRRSPINRRDLFVELIQLFREFGDLLAIGILGDIDRAAPVIDVGRFNGSVVRDLGVAVVVLLLLTVLLTV